MRENNLWKYIKNLDMINSSQNIIKKINWKWLLLKNKKKYKINYFNK